MTVPGINAIRELAHTQGRPCALRSLRLWLPFAIALANALSPSGSLAAGLLVTEKESWQTGAQYHPVASEIVRLPQFCWGQFNPEFKDKGPQYNLLVMPNCGVGMNHYCPALLALSKVRRAVDAKLRSRWLQQADAELQYTLRNVQAHPRCPLREHVEKSFQEWRMMKLRSR